VGLIILLNDSVEGYAIVLLSEDPPIGPNAFQRQTGVDITTHMKGEIPYSSLRIIRIPLVREELKLKVFCHCLDQQMRMVFRIQQGRTFDTYLVCGGVTNATGTNGGPTSLCEEVVACNVGEWGRRPHQ